MRIKRLFIALILGLGLTWALLSLLGTGPVAIARAVNINDVNTTDDELNSDGDIDVADIMQVAAVC
jgi:hypothetical protein